MKRFGSAAWNGDLREGNGSVSTESRALQSHPYTFFSRYGEKPGTNPEELLGAAHAACFTMSFVRMLGMAQFVPEQQATFWSAALERPDSAKIISKMTPIARRNILGRASVGTPSAPRAKSNRSALLLRLERPSDVGQRLLGDRVAPSARRSRSSISASLVRRRPGCRLRPSRRRRD